MSAAAVARVTEAIGPHVAGLMAQVEARLEAVAAGVGNGLAAHAGATIAAGGKRLRPLLVFLAAGAPPEDPDPLVRGAVAVELIHSATLVHDDVLDAAALRRGVPTVVAEAGREMATATGDALFSRAFAEVAAGGRPDHVVVLSEASTALARGELKQRAGAWDVALPLEDYLERCRLKTASLFAAACALGDRTLTGFGTRIGLAFQVLDDVLDVSGPAERTGKAPGTDLLDGTVTLPFILARDRDPGLAALDLRGTVRTPADAAAVCDRITATGALEIARERALELVAEAKTELPEGLGERQRLALELVADGVVERFA